MKRTSEAFNLKMQDTLRTYRPRMTIDGVELIGSACDGLTIKLGTCGSDNSLVGGVVYVPSFSATIAECGTVIQNKEIKLEMGLYMDDDSIEYVDVGYFTVDKPSVTKHQTSFEAYGRLMSKCGGTYTSALTYPATVEAVVAEIDAQYKTATGDPSARILFSGFTTEKQILVASKMSLVSLRDALGTIAGLIGGYVTETADGDIVIAKYSATPNATISTARCYSYPVTHDSIWEATGLTIVVPSGESDDEESETVEYTSGEPVNVRYENEFMTQSIFDAIKNNILGLAYMPASVEFLGDIRLEPGDVLTVTDSETPDIIVPCMEITHVWDGGIVTTVTAPGNTEAEEDGSFTGPLSKAVDEVRAQVGRFGTVIADKAVVKVLESDELNAKVGNITDAKIRNLEVGSINGNAIKNSAVLAKALSQEMVETALGVKVFYQAEQPTATKAGDIWYVTVADKDFDPQNDVIKQWTGSSWEVIKSDVQSVFMANSIVAQDIAANTITANEVNMDSLQTEIEYIGDKNADHVVIDDDSIAIKNADIELFKVEANRDSVAHKISSIINLVGAKIEASAPLSSAGMKIFAWSGVTKFVGLGDGLELGYFDSNEETGIKIVPSHSDGLMTQYPPYIDIRARKDDLEQGIVNNGRITVGDYPSEEDGSGEINPPTMSVKEDFVNINAAIKKNGLTIGEIIQTYTEGNTALTASTAKSVASITLPKGSYVIQGNARFNSISAAGTRLLSISTNTTMNYNAYAETYVPASNYGYVNVTRILEVTADNTTVNLLAYCGSAINVSYRYLKAIRIG